MSNIERSILTPPRPEGGETTSVVEVLSSVLTALRRHYWLLLASVVTCLVLAIIVIVSQTPIYKTTATLYIDPRDSRGFQEAGGILLNSDALIVDSEIEIILSSTLAERVVDRLGLASVAEPEAPSLAARLKALLMPSEAEDDQSGVLSPQEAAKRRAVSSLLSNIEVARRGDTYVIEITVQDSNKQRTAAIANAYTEEYLKSSLETQSSRFSQLNSWSSTALREALVSLQRAEAGVNRFKLDNQIDSDGAQVAASELAQTNVALVTLRSGRFQNEMILDRIRSFLKAGGVDSNVPDVGDDAIKEIRSRILQTEIEYAKLIATTNTTSPQAVIMARDLKAMRAQLVDQYQQIKAQLVRQVQSSMAEEQQLTVRAESLRREVAYVSEKEAKLRELQMRSEGERAVYQALLTRFNETSDVLAYKSNSARVLTAAQVPAGPSSPQISKILALGVVAGAFIGFVLIFIREQFDRGIRQPSEIEAMGLRYLGAMPRIPGVWFRWARRRRRGDLSMPFVSGGRRRREMALMSAAVDFPLSDLSETVRSIVFDAASRSRKSDAAQIIAVTSVAPGEGKSVLAANLATYFSKQGKRVLLVDFDLKNPELSRLFSTRRTRKGAGDQTEAGPAASESEDWNLPADFEFSGTAAQASASDIIELFKPELIANYLESLKSDFDVVIIDAGALSGSSDARMCANLADYVVLAVKWNATSADQIERVLLRGLSRPDKSVAAVMTMVPPSERLERSAGTDQAARRLQVA